MSNLWAYINFNDYEYGTSDTWITDTQSGYENNDSRLLANGYSKMSYALQNVSEKYYNYLGTSMSTSIAGIESLIGLPAVDSDTATYVTIIGLCDWYDCRNETTLTFAILRGASTHSGYGAGIFCSNIVEMTYIYPNVAFRTMFIM